MVNLLTEWYYSHGYLKYLSSNIKWTFSPINCSQDGEKSWVKPLRRDLVHLLQVTTASIFSNLYAVREEKCTANNSHKKRYIDQNLINIFEYYFRSVCFLIQLLRGPNLDGFGKSDAIPKSRFHYRFIMFAFQTIGHAAPFWYYGILLTGSVETHVYRLISSLRWF